MTLPTPADILDMADPAYLEELTTRLLRAGYGLGRNQSSEEVEILVSPGFGAGWVTWHHGSREEQLFMLRYQPFIDALKAGEPLDEERFKADFLAAFPEGDVPYDGGLGDLTVYTVPRGSVVRLDEYDGSESITTYTDLLKGGFLIA